MPVDVLSFIARRDAGGKFVVLCPASQPDDGVVVFSDFGMDSQHRHIVERWAKSRGLSLHASGMRVAGGGWWKYSDSGLTLYGLSIEYGPFDREWLRMRIRAGTVMGESAIHIR